MKTRLIHLIYAGLLLFLAIGCRNGNDEPVPAEGKVKLTLNVSPRSGSRAPGDIPEKEKIHTLRIIILSESKGSEEVEYNELLTFTDGVTEITNRTFEVNPSSFKTVYFLANVEDYGWDLTKAEDLNRINGYTLTQEQIAEAKYLPMSSVYSYEMETENKEFNAYVAYAATKFTFTFENKMNKDVPLLGLSIISIADKCYLLPQGAPNDWLTTLGNKGTVTQYDMPEETVHEEYEYPIEQSGLTIPANSDMQLPAFYLPESRYTDPETGEQNYTLRLLFEGEDETGNTGNAPLDFTLGNSDGGDKLKSLFRSTHVNVHVVIKNLGEITIYYGLYGMIEDWGTQGPATGTIEEVKQGGE